MPLRSTTATDNPDACRLDKPNATVFTVQVANQPVLCELNVPPAGRGGEFWGPPGGIELRPGYWTFTARDFNDLGGERASGIRFRRAVVSDPQPVVTAS